MRRSAIIRWRSSVMRSSVVKGTGSEEPQEPAPNDGAGEYPLRAITDSDRPYWKELRPTTLPRIGLVQPVLVLQRSPKGQRTLPAPQDKCRSGAAARTPQVPVRPRPPRPAALKRGGLMRLGPQPKPLLHAPYHSLSQ